MRHVTIFCAALLLVLLAAAPACASVNGAAAVHMSFEAFKLKHGKRYANAVEEAKRRGIFASNLKRIEAARKANPLATFGANAFADRLPQELRTKITTDRAPTRDAATPVPSYPTSIDWRTRGAVSPVINQGQCGTIICGIAFKENVEGVWAAAGYEMVPLSPVAAMLCAYPGSCGCYWRGTYEYYLNNQSGRVQTWNSWPYNSSTQCEATGQCDVAGRKFGARILSMVEVAADETSMAESVGNHGPIGVVVDADAWQFYTAGVLSTCGSDNMSHVAAIVGYDDTANPPYWIIKNSWGTSWGEDGFIRVEKGKNLCGITYRPLTANV